MDTLLSFLLNSDPSAIDQIIEQVNVILQDISTNIYNQALYLEDLSAKLNNIIVWLLGLSIVCSLSLFFNVTLTLRMKRIQEEISKMEKK